MKKALRIVGVVVGLMGVVWAMRDRFFSIAASREPAPPVFKSAPPLIQVPAAGAVVDDLTTIRGIGPVYATRLQEMGFTSFRALSQASAESVAAAAKVATSLAQQWITGAAQRAE